MSKNHYTFLIKKTKSGAKHVLGQFQNFRLQATFENLPVHKIQHSWCHWKFRRVNFHIQLESLHTIQPIRRYDENTKDMSCRVRTKASLGQASNHRISKPRFHGKNLLGHVPISHKHENSSQIPIGLKRYHLT